MLLLILSHSFACQVVNAPVTKAIVVSVVATTLFASISGVQSKLGVRADAILLRGEAWRLLTHNFLFATPGELLFGVVLLYYFRQFERQMGSSRFFAFSLAASSIYTLFLVLLDFFLPPTVFLSSGPYAFIFSYFVQFFFETPKIYQFQLLGSLSLSDKSFPYLLAAQMLVSAFPRSLFCLLCAVGAGIILRLPSISANLQTPAPIVHFATIMLLPLMDTAATTPRRISRRRGVVRSSRTHTPAASSPLIPDDGASNQDGVPQNSQRQADHNGEPGPFEPHIGAITAIGFTREQAIEALAQTGNDVQRAAERLISS